MNADTGVLRLEPDGMNHLLIDAFRTELATRNLKDDRFFRGQGPYEEALQKLKMEASNTI